MSRFVLPWFATLLAAGASPKMDFAFGILAGQRGDKVAAAAAVEKARVADPMAFPLVDRRAEALRAGGDIEGASTLYRDFAKAAPERLDAQIAYADFLRSASPDDDFASKIARETLEKSLQRHPGNLGIQMRLFRIYEVLGQREKSLELFEKLAGPDAGDG
jgi:Tfp pilus assembly protein PilF